MKLSTKRLFLILFGLLGLAVIVYAFLPKPVAVEVAEIVRGPLSVTVRDDGKTRIKERYVISAPLGGRLRRVPYKPGHKVEANRTVLAVIEPPDPQLLDPRTRAEAEARVQAAEAARRQSMALVERSRASYELAQTEAKRSRVLFEAETLSRQNLDQAELAARTTAEELNAAEFSLRIAEYELEQARAALLQSEPDGGADGGVFEIHSPIDGEVLRVLQESATVVTPGFGIIEVGNPRNLEIEIDVLSTDAVNIRPGARVWLEYWGGPKPLEARVRVVEPAGFTKISALGIEEQRVWIIADFVAPREEWQNLGDAYRVEARIVTWESDDVLKVPTGALFRHGNKWAVFTVENDRARLRVVEIGHRSEHEAELQSGLPENARVIRHPSDKIADGVSVNVNLETTVNSREKTQKAQKPK